MGKQVVSPHLCWSCAAWASRGGWLLLLQGGVFSSLERADAAMINLLERSQSGGLQSPTPRRTCLESISTALGGGR
jgi:hypothetical protein